MTISEETTNNNATPAAPAAPAAPVSPENENSDTINNVDANTAAAGITAEDTAVITEQREMINTLIEHTKSLQQQINSLMRSGASITDDTAQLEIQQQARQEDTSEPYVTFADLGREMGNRRYENKNMEGD